MAFGIQGVTSYPDNSTQQQQSTLQSDVRNEQPEQQLYHRSAATDPLDQLDLSSSQQSQIEQIINNGVINGDSSTDVLSALDNVLTPAQQQTLASLSAPPASYTSTGAPTASASLPHVLSIAA